MKRMDLRDGPDEVYGVLVQAAEKARNWPQSVPAAVHRLAGFPIRRMPLSSLLARMWELGNNAAPYDATYVR